MSEYFFLKVSCFYTQWLHKITLSRFNRSILSKKKKTVTRIILYAKNKTQNQQAGREDFSSNKGYYTTNDFKLN